MRISYILTTFSPAMFGDKASIHLKTISVDEAKQIIDDKTEIVATRASHENLAKNIFGITRTARFADMRPEKEAILIHYRGPAVSDDGLTPATGVVTLYLIESENYLEAEDECDGTVDT